MTEIPFLAKQRIFVRNLDSARQSDVLEGVHDEEETWKFEGMMTAEKLLLPVLAVGCEWHSASERIGARLCLRQLSTPSSWLVKAPG